MFEIDIAAADRESARAELGEMCERLLANTVIENYEIEIVD